MTNILLIVLGMAVAGLAVLFAIENASVVSLSILEFRSRQLPLFVWLAVAFLAGLALGLVVATRVFFRAKSRESNFRKALAAAREELPHLRQDSVLK